MHKLVLGLILLTLPTYPQLRIKRTKGLCTDIMEPVPAHVLALCQDMRHAECGSQIPCIGQEEFPSGSHKVSSFSSDPKAKLLLVLGGQGQSSHCPWVSA